MAGCAACRTPLLAAGAGEALTAAVLDADVKVSMAAVRALYNISCSIWGCRELVARGSVHRLLSALQRPSLGALAHDDPSPSEYGTAATAALGPSYVGGGIGDAWAGGGGMAGAVEPRYYACLAKVVKRLALYGNDGGAVQREVQQALARTSIL
jgi:hypothetical protein